MPPGKRFENWVVNKVLSRWQKLWSRQRRKKLVPASAKRGSYEGDPGACPQEKIWKPGLPAFWSKN